MKQLKTKFKDSMYDYANINEYFSFYGNVIYISSDYLLDQEYFLILKKHNKYAFVYIEKPTLDYFSSLDNRDDLIEDLENIEQYIQFVEGFNNFTLKLNYYLNNKAMHLSSKNELIAIKNNPESFWNTIQIEHLIKLHKKNGTIKDKELLHDSHFVGNNVIRSLTTASNVYHTQFNILFEWIVGNPFMDITIVHFNSKVERRLHVYDIKELSNVLLTMSKLNDETSMKASYEFSQNG